jgi:hypothetical protein
MSSGQAHCFGTPTLSRARCKFVYPIRAKGRRTQRESLGTQTERTEPCPAQGLSSTKQLPFGNQAFRTGVIGMQVARCCWLYLNKDCGKHISGNNPQWGDSCATATGMSLVSRTHSLRISKMMLLTLSTLAKARIRISSERTSF